MLAPLRIFECADASFDEAFNSRRLKASIKAQVVAALIWLALEPQTVAHLVANMLSFDTALAIGLWFVSIWAMCWMWAVFLRGS